MTRTLPSPLPNQQPPKKPKSVRQEILETLTEMFPDRPPAEIAQIAASLAREYEAERVAALKELGPKKFQPPMVPHDYQGEWRWDGNKPVPVTDEYRQSQRAAQKKSLDFSNERLRQQEAGRNRYKQPVSGGRPGGGRWLGPVMPGDAQPIQPSTGTRYGEADDSLIDTMVIGGNEVARRPANPQAEIDRLKSAGTWDHPQNQAVRDRLTKELDDYNSVPEGYFRLPDGSLQPNYVRSVKPVGGGSPGVRSFPAIGRGLGGPMTPDQQMAAYEDQQFRYGMRKERALSGLM